MHRDGSSARTTPKRRGTDMPESTAPTDAEIAKACRADAEHFQGLADWYREHPDPAYGALAETFAEGTALRIELIVHWLGFEAEKRERYALATVR